MNDLLNNKVIFTECLCCDYHLGLYVVEKIGLTALYCFLLVCFYDWIQTFFKLGGENQGVFYYGAIWGSLCCALVVVPVFFKKKNELGKRWGYFWLTDCEGEIKPLVSHFNINAIGGFKCLLYELMWGIFSFNEEEVQGWSRKHKVWNSNQVETSWPQVLLCFQSWERLWSWSLRTNLHFSFSWLKWTSPWEKIQHRW